jgi:hypothetical protein
MRNIRRYLMVAIAALTLLGMGSAAHAQYQGDATLTVSDPSPTCGETVVITGTGFLPNAEVVLSIGDTEIGTVTSDAEGNFTFDYVTSCAATGNVVITATDGTNVLTVSLTVGGTATPPTTAGTLTPTGSDSTTGLVQVGLGLVLAGGLIALAVRSRSTRATSSVNA